MREKRKMHDSAISVRYLFRGFLCDAEQCDEAAPAGQETVVLVGSMPAVALIDLKTASTYLPYSL